jgi:hypothetical protein
LTPHHGTTHKTFLQKHQQLFVFIGALIVFGTFLIREGFREYLKSIVESEGDTAKLFILRFDERINFLEIRKLYGMLEEHMGNDPATRARRGYETADPNLYSAAIKENAARLDRDRAWIENIRQLVVATGVKGDINKDIDAAEKHRTDLLDRGEKSVRFMHAFAKADAARMTKVSQNGYESVISFQTEIEELDATIGGIAQRALESAEKQRIRAERWYGRCSIASYILYVIGWGLGLIGKLYGVETVGGE